MYAVIFMDRKGAAMLGTFDDKGQCRRAWRTITTGAAVVDSAGSVLEYKTGTPDAAKRKLDAHAEWMKREGKLPPPGSAAPPEQPRATLRVKSIEVEAEEDEDDDEEDAPATKPAPAQAPVAPAATEVLAEVKWDSAPAAPEDFRGEGPQPLVSIACPPRYVGGKCESCGVPVPFPSDFCGPCDQRRAAPALDVTHAIAPATGAVVQGDDTERLAPPAAEPPVTCAARGCVAHRGVIRSNTDPALAPLCGPHRKLCHDRARTMGTVAAVAEALVAGTLPSAHEAQVAAGKATAAAKRRAAPAAVTCESKGCDHAPGIARSNVRPEWRPFCGACRVIIRQRGRAFPGGEAAVMEHLRAGTLPPVDAKRAALGAKGGRNSRASQSSSRPTRPRKPTPAPAPKPRRPTSPAATLAAGLETARACAEVVSRLGGLGPAREIAALVEEHGGAAAVREALAALAEMGGMAA